MAGVKKSGLQKNIEDVDPYNLGVDAANIHQKILDANDSIEGGKEVLRRSDIEGIKKMRYPEYTKGGIVKATGLAKVHKGELVIPKSALEKAMAQKRLLGAVDHGWKPGRRQGGSSRAMKMDEGR